MRVKLSDEMIREIADIEKERKDVSVLTNKLFDVLSESRVSVDVAERALDRAKALTRVRSVVGN